MCVIFFIIRYDYVHGIDVVQFIQLLSGMKTEIVLSSNVNMTITSAAVFVISFFTATKLFIICVIFYSMPLVISVAYRLYFSFFFPFENFRE